MSVRREEEVLLATGFCDRISRSVVCRCLILGLSGQDVGVRSMAELHAALMDGSLRIELRSPAAQREGGVHSLHSFDKRTT